MTDEVQQWLARADPVDSFMLRHLLLPGAGELQTKEGDKGMTGKRWLLPGE